MKKVILILGTGRSGTSWVHDVTTSHYNYRKIFEPLHPVQIPSMSELAGMYLDEADSSPVLSNYLDKVFHGRTGDSWLTWVHMGISRDTALFRKALQFLYNLPTVKFWASNRVVKFIQANLMVSWLADNYGYPIVYVIRNPYSVIRSQMNMGWSHDLSVYTQQKKVQDELLGYGMLEYVNSLETVIERLAARWCIENLVAIREIGESGRKNIIFPVTYEYLSTGRNIERLLDKLGYTGAEINSIRRKCSLRESLRSTRRKSTGSVPLGQEQKLLIGVVLKRFGISSYEELTGTFNTCVE